MNGGCEHPPYDSIDHDVSQCANPLGMDRWRRVCYRRVVGLCRLGKLRQAFSLTI
jgi:hypothetical protein